ncbi:FixH family protein [Mangrovibacterium lignilyticum]|uniref:FixH family protein n=1 Tax=Mangrovibacterium lignilyticum TaxID=2668052 RepID=UPI0013CF6567|nr:FixH family protein [Mangrovibacterium lignilyticum]
MKIRFNWGTGIVLAMFVMICGMLYLVYMATSQDYFLVEKDYYQRGINYQDQIDRINNGNSLREKPQIVLSDEMLTIQFPAWFANKTIEGEVLIYSPVSDRLDKSTKLRLDETLTQRISLDSTKPGRYTVKLDWTADNTDYYRELQITIK